MKKIILIATILLAALVLPSQAFAAIARDNHIDGVSGGVGTGSTVPFTDGSGTNRILFVAVLKQGSQTVTSVTYAGVAMTQIESVLGYTTEENLYIYMLVNPASGTNNIVTTYSGSGVSLIYAASFTGAAQSGQPDTHTNQRNTSASSLTSSLTTVVDNSWIYGFFRTSVASQSAGANTSFLAADADVNQGDTNADQVPAGSHSMTTNSSASGVISHMLVSFAAATSTTVFPTTLQVESQTNPTAVATSNPRFSALVTSASTTAIANSYQIQIAASATTTWTTTYWDSGQKTLSSSTPKNMRTPQIYSTTTFPLDNKTYYWRMRLWDQYGGVGDWSTMTAFYTMDYVPSYPTTTLQDIAYTYDAMGNITKISDRSGTNGAGTSTYTYDNLYRLTNATTTNAPGGNYTQSYVYDWLGNITNKSDQGAYTYAATSYANPDAVTQITTTAPVSNITLSYDSSGNMTAMGSSTYTWDYRNRMTDNYNSTGGATTTHYTYDANNQRVTQSIKKGSAATTTTNYWNQFYETTGATTTMYIYAGGQLVATVEGKGSGTTTNMIHTDHLGGMNVVSSATGTLKQLASYYPFGEMRLNEKSSATFDEKKKFIGQTFDDTTSLSYLNARYYDGHRGQFTSQDPVSRDIATMGKQDGYIIMLNQTPVIVDQTSLLSDPQLLNSYSYSENNPITKSDPSGKCGVWCIAVGLLSPQVAYSPAPGQEGQTNNKMESGIMVAGLAAPGGAQKKVGAEIIKAGETVAGLKVTTHAAEQFAERSMSVKQISTALKDGVKYLDNKTENLVHVVGERGKGGYTIVTDTAQKVLVTAQNFVQKLSPTRYEKINK